MTTHNYLTKATEQLAIHGIETARLDALVLMEDVLNLDRAQILADPDREITDTEQQKLVSLISRRSQHEPLAYIRGKAEFYGRDFIVSPAVLVPRPESETIIELLRTEIDEQKPGTHSVIIDVGTGSGALAITAKLEFPVATVTGIDIDPACLIIAQQNADALKADVHFTVGDLLEPLIDSPKSAVTKDTVLLCNLPYVPDSYPINDAARHEPKLALFAGEDGLDLYRKLFTQISQLESLPTIIAESLPSQHEALLAIAKQYGYHLQAEDDFIQAFSAS